MSISKTNRTVFTDFALTRKSKQSNIVGLPYLSPECEISVKLRDAEACTISSDVAALFYRTNPFPPWPGNEAIVYDVSYNSMPLLTRTDSR